jgi:hypothetical protein
LTFFDLPADLFLAIALFPAFILLKSTHWRGCNSVLAAMLFYSYTGVPSDLNFFIRFPWLPELLEEVECDSAPLSSPPPRRLRAPLAPKTTATRKANMPVVTPYINIASAMRQASPLSKIKLSHWHFG